VGARPTCDLCDNKMTCNGKKTCNDKVTCNDKKKGRIL
jgi:hypothetical protein